MLQYSSCVFPIVSIRSLMPWQIFACIVPVLPSNSGSVFKLVTVSAYELGFRRSGYQNRSEFFWIRSSLALPGSENFILAKNWSQDPLFVVTSFLSILSMIFEFSTGHAFHLFKLIFSMVTCFVLLSEKIKKIKRKSLRIQKNNDSPKIEKREGEKWNNILRST